MQNAKTGSFCLQIINWVKNCFGLANGRCCRTFNHLPYSRYVEYILQQKTDGGQIRSQSYEQDW